ncbi:CaiB/BaiF CoA transferase family protein [Actinomadura sp. NTSP31]|uniref:CaiB/BaiF CoA transferase family protein n=1 Tax=Actinomadura sp. NTSP31 TaxID=1735447 RepID=UPI0035C1C7AB
MTEQATGPLAGVRVLEIQAMGPGPFCAMMLSDFGAEVIRVDRVGTADAGNGVDASADVLSRGRRSVAVDLKRPAGADLVLRMVEHADVLIEGYRPGVMERLGLGPDACLARNPRLIYGRVTGWGQDGPWASHAGHDINYISLAGVLWPIGRDGDAPVPPLNYVGDFGGGGMLLAVGICAALAERASSGRGQVIDAAMVDGAALLNSFMYGMRAAGQWSAERGRNLLDTGAPFYETYETADGKWVSIGSIESKFFRNLVTRLGLEIDLGIQGDEASWPILREELAAVFRTRTRDEWTALLADAEGCFAPVLSPWEAPEHPHNAERGTFVESFGVTQPSPAPRFGRTPAAIGGPPPRCGEHTDEVLGEFGLDVAEIARLRTAGDIA